jgi:NADPH-dependent curcumin reductase CurA
MTLNKGFVLASRPTGAPSAENFRLVTQELPEPAAGQVLVRHDYLSLDPYMRGRMNDAKSYAAPQKLDEIMVGGTVGTVVASQNPAFKTGDKVVGMGGWQLYALSSGSDLRVIKPGPLPIQAYLGAIGMPGVTGWYGVSHILEPKAGETMVVSAATGAVGSVVGQLLKRAGARAVGVAGGPDKCAYAVKELGYELCIDHKRDDFEAALKAALPNGIDGIFENVGGKPFQSAIRRLNPFARIALCGLVASRYDGTATPLPDVGLLLATRSKIQGFIVSDHLALWPQALTELAGYAIAGELKWRETIAEGLESAPAAFLGMLKGENFGKQLVKLT